MGESWSKSSQPRGEPTIFHKLKSGDRVYLLTARSDEMYLLGAITVDAIVNQAEATARLGRNPDEL